MFLCSIIGVIIISIMVVAVTNKLEMTTLQAKAYSVIKKVEIKQEYKKQAALLIGKTSKLHLMMKKVDKVPVKDIYELEETVNDFKYLRR